MSQFDQSSSRAGSRVYSRDPSREGSPVQTPREQRHRDRQRSRDEAERARDARGGTDRPGAADERADPSARRDRERGAGAGLESRETSCERFSIGTASANSADEKERDESDGKMHTDRGGEDAKSKSHGHAGYERPSAQSAERTADAGIWKKAEMMEQELRELRTQFEEQSARVRAGPKAEVDIFEPPGGWPKPEPLEERHQVEFRGAGAQRGGEPTGEREERLLGIVEKLCGKLSEDRKEPNGALRAGAQRVNKNPPKFASLAPGANVHALNEWITTLKTYVRGTWPRTGPPMLEKVLDVCTEHHGQWVDEEYDQRERWIPTLTDVELSGDEVDAHGLMCSDIASRLPTATQAWAESRATERGDAPSLVDYLFRTLCVTLPSSSKAGDKIRECMEGPIRESEKPDRHALSGWLRAWKAQLQRLEDLEIYEKTDNYSKLLNHIISVTNNGQSEEFRHSLLTWRENHRIPVKRVTREYCMNYFYKVLSLADNCYADAEPKHKKEAHLAEKKKKKTPKEVNATEKEVNVSEKEVNATSTEFKGGGKGKGSRGPGPDASAGRKRDPLPCRHGKECKWGAECRYSHDPKVIAETKKSPCKSWSKTGRCTWGKMCVFMHAQALYAGETEERATPTEVYAAQQCSPMQAHLAQKLGQDVWGIYDVAAQETVVGDPRLVETQRGDAIVKTVAGTTAGKHVDATTPYGTATNATYVPGARNLLAHQTITRLGMVGFSWFNGRAPQNVRPDGPALYGKDGEIIPLQEQDGFALVPKHAEVHHASGVREEVGQRMPCWRCGGVDHWAAACVSPSDGGASHAGQAGDAGVWHWTSMPERSRRILWKALCKAGFATEGYPDSYWASSSMSSVPPTCTARMAIDLDVDSNWNVLLVTKIESTTIPGRVERRIIRVYWGTDTAQEHGHAGDPPVQEIAGEDAAAERHVRFDPEVQAYHTALGWVHEAARCAEVCGTEKVNKVVEVDGDAPEPAARAAGASIGEEVTTEPPTSKSIRNARRRCRNAEAVKILDAISKDMTIKDRNAMAHRILNHRTIFLQGCVTCALAKQRRDGHKHVGVSKTRGTGYWHSDIAGPFPAAQDGAQYVIAIVTEADGEQCPYVGYYAMTSRHSAVVAKHLEEHARVVGARPKVLRTDGANDYRGKVTEWIEGPCSPAGEPPAKHDPTYRYSPWENGVSESAVEVSGDGVRTALLDGNAPTVVWPYALRWVRDTEALATGAFERLYGEEAANKARGHVAPFASLVTVVREEPEKTGKSFDSRAFRAFLIGYEPDGGVRVAYQNGMTAAGDPRFRELRTRNFKIFRNEPFFKEGTKGGPLFEAKRSPGEHEATHEEDDSYVVTWVECGREGCGKWREVLPNEARAIAEVEQVTCEMMGIDCNHPQDPRAFSEPTVEANFVVKDEVANTDEHWVEVYLFEPVKRKLAFSDEEYYDGKLYKELFGEALEKELGMYVHHGALRIDKAVESGDKSIPPEALRARLNLIYGFKDAEDPDRKKHRAKARMVACRQWDRWGTVSDGIGEEEMLWSATPTFDSIRLTVTVESGHGKEKKIVDWPAAYLQRKLKGPPVFGILPREAWPKEWEGKFVNPLVPIEGAVYGLKRAGHDYNAQADDEYHKLGWISCRAFDADPCVYIRKSARENAPDAIARWTDDNFVCVEKGDSTRTLDELGTVFPHEVKARFDLPQKYVGIITNVESVNEHLEKITYDQVRYTRGIVDEFNIEYKKHFPGKILRQKDAPLPAGVARDDSLEGGDTPGVFADTCRKYMGALNFVQRCTRPDIAYSVSLLCGALDKWGKGADELLIHLFGYLDKHWNLILVCWVDKRDFLNGGKDLKLVLKSDASFAPGGANKGTSGWIVFLMGPRTCAIIGWGANRQKVESLHTAESELHAIVTGTRALTRIANLGDALMGFAREADAIGEVQEGPELQQQLQVDASATERALKLGFSDKFSHSRRTHRISLAWAHHYWAEPREVELVSGKDFVPDALTKSLPTEPHLRYVGDMCLRPGPGLGASA